MLPDAAYDDRAAKWFADHANILAIYATISGRIGRCPPRVLKKFCRFGTPRRNGG